jgi:cytochrome c553
VLGELDRWPSLWCLALAAASLVVFGAAWPLRAAPAERLAYGTYLAAECATCHSEGESTGGIPSLRALPYDRLAAVLAAYRDGSRSNPTMQTVARSLGRTEIAALAAYLATLACAPPRVNKSAC